MSRQNTFMRSTGHRFCNNCQNGCKNDCNDQHECCDNKDPCVVCPPGPEGAQGPQELPGGVLGYADFYALMPPDDSATVAPGTDVSFPQNVPIANTNIGRLGPSSFNLGPIGTYQILFQISVTEARQLILTLNGQDPDYTVAGRATGTSQIVGMAVVRPQRSTLFSLFAIPLATPPRLPSLHLQVEPALFQPIL